MYDNAYKFKHLLADQCSAQSSLRFCHGGCLLELEEQRCQKNEGYNPDSLSHSRAEEYFKILSHVAQKRAVYFAILDQDSACDV